MSLQTAAVASGNLTEVFDTDLGLNGSSVKTLNLGLNHDVVLNGVLSAAGSIVKAGAGTLTLTNANSYSGTTTVSAGVLQLGNGGTTGSLLPANTITVDGGATFSINQNDTVTQGTDFSAAAIAGSGTFEVKGGATVVVTNSATFDNGGSVSVASDSFLNLDFTGTDVVAGIDLGAGPVPVGEYGATGSGAANTTDRITGTGMLYIPASVDWDGSDDLTWTGPSDSTSWSGDTYSDNDDVTFSDTGAGTVTISGTVAPSSTTVNSTVDYTFTGGALAGAGGLTKSGAGKLTLDSANSYTGDTIINGGSILISHNDALGTTAGTTTINHATKLFISSGITTDEAIINVGGGGGKIEGTAGGGTLTGLITLQGSMDVRGNDVTFSGGITSAVNEGLGINGSRFIINTNPIELNEGVFGFTSAGNNVANASELNVGGNDWSLLRINFGGYLKLGGSDFMPTDAGVEFGWHADNSSSGTLDLGGFDQAVAFLRQTTNFPAINGDQNVTGGGTLTIATPAGTYDYHGRITDGTTSTSIVKDGEGTQILNNQSGTVSNYSGALTINAGIVESLSGSDFSDLGAIVLAGGTLNLNYVGTDTIAALDLGAGFVADGVYDSTDSAFITGTGTLTVVAQPLVWNGSTGGDAIWTNPDSNSWSGYTYDDGDEVTFLGAGAGTVTISGTVEPASITVDSSADYTFTGGDISGSTGLTKAGTSTLTLASANTYTGVTTVSGGTLTVGDNAALGDVAGNTVVSDGSLRMEGGITLAEPLNISGGNNLAPALWSAAGSNTVTGAITGGGRIQTEAGTLTLSGGLTHTGAATLVGDILIDTAPINAAGMNLGGDSYDIGDPQHVAGRTIVLDPISGTHDWDYSLLFFSAIVELGANDIMPTDAGIRFGWTTIPNSFARLDLKSFNQTVGSIETAPQGLDVGGDVEITGSGTLTVAQAADTEYQGRLTGGLALIKSGVGTLTLNNLSGTATSHTGATTVSGGTLGLASGSFASPITVQNAASLELTLGSSVTSSAGLTLDAGSTIKISGTPTLSSYTLITASSISGTAVLDAPVAGYELVVNGNSIELNELPGYAGWAAGFPGLTDSDMALDFDGGSLETGLEYVLGGDPTDASDDLTLAPTSTYTGSALEFDFRRTDLANADANTSIVVEYGSDLSGWTTAEHGTDGVTITVTDNGYGSGIDQVVVSLPDALAVDGKIFARLSVTSTL